jgi:Cdc6-like AAA superfamily ATPase
MNEPAVLPAAPPPNPPPAEDPPPASEKDKVVEACKSATAAAEQGDNIALIAHLRRAIMLAEPNADNVPDEPRAEAVRRKQGFQRFRKVRTASTFS